MKNKLYNIEKFKKYVGKQFGKPTGVGGLVATFFMNRMNQEQYRSVQDNIKNSEYSKILEIGFGNGYHIGKMAKMNQNLFYGIDISEDMLKTASKRNAKKIRQKEMKLVLGNVEQIPFEANFFDKVYTVNTVYFWSNLDKSLEEIKRVLKEEGIFVNVIYGKEWLDKITYTQYGFHKYIPKELEDAYRRNGFEIIDIIELKKHKSYCFIARK